MGNRCRLLMSNVGRQRLCEWSKVVTKPVDQLTAPDPTRSEIEHESLLVVDGTVDLGAVENEERLHGGVPSAFVAVDKRVALNQRECQGGSFLNQSWVELNATERGFGLGDRRFEHSEIPNARCATCCLEDAAMQVDDLTQGEVTHQARRRYSSSFFRSTRSAAAWKSSSGATRRSAIAARARSSGAIPRRSAVKRSRSAWAGERSMVSFMEVLYRGDAPSNNPLQGLGCACR
jgi:hypothetical protein